MSRFRPTTALLAILALLVITTITALPIHGHENDGAPCDICHSGHLPCLQAAGEIQFSAHMAVMWQRAPETVAGHSHTASIIRSPRAPPV